MTPISKKDLHEWYVKIGKLGGQKSKRAITPKQQKVMQAGRKKPKKKGTE